MSRLTYYIPENVRDDKQIRGVPYRNIAEGILMAVLSYKGIGLIGLSITPRIISSVIICGTLAILGFVGIKQESVSEFIFSYIQFKLAKRKLSFRRLDDEASDGGIKRIQDILERGSDVVYNKLLEFVGIREKADRADSGSGEEKEIKEEPEDKRKESKERAKAKRKERKESKKAERKARKKTK